MTLLLVPRMALKALAQNKLRTSLTMLANNVCVLGQTVVDQLFGSQDPVGETIRVRDQPCVVVGVLEVKGQRWDVAG
jgi:hypothetical protein